MKNLNVNWNNIRKAAAIASICVIGLSFTACGNRDMLDTNKSFSFALITADDHESGLAVGLSKYKNYEGEQQQLILDDGTVLLTSSYNTTLVRNKTSLTMKEYAAGYLQDGAEITTISKESNKDFNKDLFDTQFTYDKAICLEGNNAVIYDISQWTDYETDDQIQLKLSDGSYVLVGIPDVILVREGKDYTASQIAYGILGSDATVKEFDPKEGFKVLQK